MTRRKATWAPRNHRTCKCGHGVIDHLEWVPGKARPCTMFVDDGACPCENLTCAA